MHEWPNLPHLLDSAHAGCRFCAVLRESILSHKFNDAWKRVTEGSVIGSDSKRFGLELSYGSSCLKLSQLLHLAFLLVKVTFEEGFTIFLNFKVEANPTEWLALDPPAIQNYDDDETTSFLKEELQNCHDGSRNDHGNAKFLPERLIDVEVNSLRLVE
ncbi:HET-domain-containing protein [Diaporthe eres]|uniref:Uncharacterized protein n=1 Tax=Diaporthe vaccinii TaxID=105482 RepID=A0ABR4EVP9_9PEZI|nr:HET-domain-containing protein [Diaporthe eres]